MLSQKLLTQEHLSLKDMLIMLWMKTLLIRSRSQPSKGRLIPEADEHPTAEAFDKWIGAQVWLPTGDSMHARGTMLAAS